MTVDHTLESSEGIPSVPPLVPSPPFASHTSTIVGAVSSPLDEVRREELDLRPLTAKFEELQTSHKEQQLDLTDQTNLLPFRKVVSVFAGLAVCIVVSTLDMTLVATALPSISADFHAGSVASFIPSTYLLTSTAFQPLYGRFSDIFGRKAALCIAMCVFMFGNLIAGFSKKTIQVIVFRGVWAVSLLL